MKKYVARNNRRYTLEEVERLTLAAFAHTTAVMWRNFCRHVEGVEKDYIAKDGIVEEEMTLTITTDSENDSDSESDSDMIDKDDRQLIDRALQQSTSTETDSNTDDITISNPRRDLARTQMLHQLDPNFFGSCTTPTVTLPVFG